MCQNVYCLHGGFDRNVISILIMSCTFLRIDNKADFDFDNIMQILYCCTVMLQFVW